MRFSTHSKMGTLLSLITIVTLICAFAVTIISHGSPTHASSASVVQASQTPAFAVRNIQVPSSSTGTSNLVSHKSAKNLPARDMGARAIGQFSYNSNTAPGVHSTSASSLVTTPGNLQQNFNGLSNLENVALNPFTAEPPDQGLCVGYLADLNTGKHIPVEFELVNDVIAIYLTNGKIVIATSLETFFGEANFSAGTFAFASDPRCHFDSQTHTFFFTVSAVGPSQFIPGSKSRVDLAAIDANTQKGLEVLIDTTDRANPHCPCFSDQPLFGIDSNAVYISSNEFTLTKSPSFQGTLLFVFAKEPIVNREFNKIPHTFFEGRFPLVVGRLLVSSVQPAINVSPAGSEYLENSVFSNKVENTLILWHVTDQNIANGVAPKLNLPPALIKVENYAFPVPAASTGSGKTANGITSASLLDAGDSRVQQVQGIQDEGRIELWSSLTTAIKIQGDPKIRDGIAWFRIDPQHASVVEQGYVFSAGNYLLYPAILHTSHGATAIVFSITSPKLNPSAAYIFSPSSPTNFGSINIAAQGANPYITFTADLRPNGSARWGDYSAAALDQSGHNIWLGTEYVPAPFATIPVTNWGTQLFEVKGS